LGIDYESIGADSGKDIVAQNLIEYARRRGVDAELFRRMRDARPQVF
jgi:hypothetical protein